MEKLSFIYLIAKGVNDQRGSLWIPGYRDTLSIYNKQ